MIPEKCMKLSKEARISCVERGKPKRKIVFKNSKRAQIQVICVDGCVPLAGNRCDNLVRAPGLRANFVELKGRNVEDAVNQIASTITQLRDFVSGDEIKAFVICNESPSVTQAQRFKPKFERDNSAELIIRTHYWEAAVY